MGKVKAREIKRAKAEYVSFVREGANGREFEIFKSANFDRDRDNLNSDEIGFFKKLVKFVKGEEEIKMADIDKLLNSIEGLNDTVMGLTNKVEMLEVKMSEEKKDEGTEPKTDSQKNNGDGGDEGTNGKDTKKAEDKSNKDNEAIDKINKSVEDLVKLVAGLSERLAKIETQRQTSNAADSDETGKDSIKKDTYDGIFFNQSALEVN